MYLKNSLKGTFSYSLRLIGNFQETREFTHTISYHYTTSALIRFCVNEFRRFLKTPYYQRITR